MNQIGSKKALPSCAPVGKENVPLISLPDWAITAKKYLLGIDLGAEWRVCVQRWSDLEKVLGYGALAGTKVCTCLLDLSDVLMNASQAALPAIALCPEEWSKWVVKARGPGRERSYQDSPNISDPAEFGTAVVKWWNAMQPPFWQTAQGMPQPLYTPPAADVEDAWAPLQRAGQNGLVTVILLLCWWGQSLNT
jgi:hypothetical protein